MKSLEQLDQVFETKSKEELVLGVILKVKKLKN